MDSALITEVARQIFTEQILLNWKFYGVLLAVYLISFFISKFFGSYFQRRGESLATKADFEQIKAQLEETTRTAKDIELSLSHKDWSLKEYKTVRRTKLEELVSSLCEVEDSIEFEMIATLSYSPEAKIFSSLQSIRSPLRKFNMLSLLYFPELAVISGECSIAANKVVVRLIDANQDIYLVDVPLQSTNFMTIDDRNIKVAEVMQVRKIASDEILNLVLAFREKLKIFELEAEKLMIAAIA